MNGFHADGPGAGNIARLIIHEDAVFSGDIECRDTGLVGAAIGLEDMGVGCVMDDIEFSQERQFFTEFRAVEKIEFV